MKNLKQISPKISASMNFAEGGGGFSVAFMTFGGAVSFLTQPLGCSYIITVPLSGHIAIATASGTVITNPKMAGITGPEGPTSQTWSADSEALWVRLHADAVQTEAQYLERSLRNLVNLPPPRSRIDLAPALDLSHGHGQEWLHAVEDFCALLDSVPGSGGGGPDLSRLPKHRLLVGRRRIIELLLRAQALNLA